jgi:hypothetical protein
VLPGPGSAAGPGVMPQGPGSAAGRGWVLPGAGIAAGHRRAPGSREWENRTIRRTSSSAAMTESGGALTHRGPVVDRRQVSRRGGLAPPRFSTDLRDQATAATTLGRVLALRAKRHSAGASSCRPFPTRHFVLARRDPGIAQACPACLSIGRCRGLASDGRRRISRRSANLLVTHP